MMLSNLFCTFTKKLEHWTLLNLVQIETWAKTIYVLFQASSSCLNMFLTKLLQYFALVCKEGKHTRAKRKHIVAIIRTRKVLQYLENTCYLRLVLRVVSWCSSWTGVWLRSEPFMNKYYIYLRIPITNLFMSWKMKQTIKLFSFT